MREETKKQCYYEKEHIWHYNETIELYNIRKPQLNNLLQRLMLNLSKRKEWNQLIF